MKLYNYTILLLTILLIISCDKYDEVNTNPDATTKVTSDLLATGLLLDITQTGNGKYFVYDDFLCKYMAWGEDIEPYQYNIFDRSSFSGYKSLINANKMVELAHPDMKNAYEGLSCFLKAYKLFYISMEMGDIPYNESLNGENGGIKPVYNTQKDVMLFVLKDLEKAYTLFSISKDFAGDPILGGKIDKWKKIVVAFELKVLMNLSKKESDPDLKVKERFSSLVSSKPLMESNNDNFQLTYSDKANTVYPLHYTQTKHAGYTMLSTTLINVFKETKDPRLFYYAKPAASKLAEGLTKDDWNAYVGVNPAWAFDKIKKMYSAGDYCGLNPRYTNLPSGEPLIRIGFSEQNFILSEAVLRGWISGDASVYYEKAIRATLDFITDNTPNDVQYNNGHPLTEEMKINFIKSPKIRLSGTTEEKLEQILTQRYLASFLQYPWDPYYDYRRTGFPKLPIDSETNQNPIHDKIPMRWMYPKSEYDYNTENVNVAVDRQYSGSDDVNKLMWILQ